MIYVINYSDAKYEANRKANTSSAYKYGKVDKVIEYSPSDIDPSFVEENKKIFEYKRGAGLWLWKPYIIKRTLEFMKDGEWLFYCDAGALFIDKVDKLVDFAIAQNTNILLFDISLLNRQFTKREAFIKMGVEDHSENQILSGYILLKKCQESIALVDEWLEGCKDEQLNSYERMCPEIEEWPDFFAHREDQSVLTLLALKHGYKSYRDPSDYGEFPMMYSHNEGAKCVPLKHEESKYPTIVLGVRKADPKKYKRKYYIKKLLSFFHLYNG